ncbi:MAG: hydroxymethylglutaryl-CoA synthase [Chloroflexota bacterium]|nr:MAG: hydroxymethylglutaryl-CoA synthase [Chloroflexota bacterium]
MAGIVSYGAYIPFHRLPRAIINAAWGRNGGSGELAVANYDEDSITMAVAAGMDCMKEFDSKAVDALFLGTTSAPYKERLNATIVASALDLPENARNADLANCLRTGTLALLSAMDAVCSRSLGSVLVAASDVRLGAASGENEQSFGNGAAALLIGRENVAAEIEGTYTISEDFPDYYRSSADTFVRSAEDRWTMDEAYTKFPIRAAAQVMEKCGLTQKDFAKVCLYGPSSRKHLDLGKKMGFKPEQIQESLLDTVGNTGSALPLMVLVAALEEASPNDRILLVSYGSGSDALVLRVTDEIQRIRNRRGIRGHLNAKRTLGNYEKYVRWRELMTLEAQARPEKDPVSPSSLWRERQSAMSLYGAICRKCGTPQLFLDYSSARPRICLECHAKDELEPYRFADKRGKVFSFSHDYLAVSQDPPNTITIVDFVGGGRGVFEMTDRNPEECRVGMGVEMTFRKLSTSPRGIHNYFWKCKPITDQDDRG